MAGSNHLDPEQNALSEAFFRGDAKAQREHFELRLAEKAARGEIAAATGVDDPELLAELAGLGIRVDTLAALTLIPLIGVAWSDGVLDAAERAAILAAAAAAGIESESASYRLLEIWMEEEPAPDVTDLWYAFTRALCASLESAEVDRLRENILGRARAVAAAAGDALERTPHVSDAEERSLAGFDALFDV